MEEKEIEHLAMNIVYQIGDALYDALPLDVAHNHFVTARQKTNDWLIDFTKHLIKLNFDLAVSKERERIVEVIEKMKIEKYRGFPLEVDEKAVNETCRRVINLINTK